METILSYTALGVGLMLGLGFLGLGIGIGRFIVILLCIYFVVKWAVKKGIAEYYEEKDENKK